MTYRHLDPEKIIGTIERLGRRIGERFPNSGLGSVAADLLLIGRDARRRSEWIGRPLILLRVGVGLAIGLVLLAVVESIVFFTLSVEGSVVEGSVAKDSEVDLFEFIQILEPAVNVVVLIGAALLFLMTTETRVKRRRALEAISELRALAHVIDMHQLTKDPERILVRWQATPSSPQGTMTTFALNRYLDYCSEMLSLVGKIAALYSQRFNDAAALAAVEEVETLTTGLARKIWQKIMVLNTVLADAATRDVVKSQPEVSAATPDGHVPEVNEPTTGTQ